jgi:hypothetical protein
VRRPNVFDPIAALREAEVPVDQLSDPQREVLSALTEAEIAVLASVQRRLREVQRDVVAHDMKML